MFELENIAYSVGSKKLLHDVSFQIKAGGMLAIMGLNGAGKTTLIKIMSSYLKPLSGAVFFDESFLNRLSRKEQAQKIAFVPQDFPTDFPFTVFDFVMMGRFAWQKGLSHGTDDHEKVRFAIKRLRLEGMEDRLLPTLSGGEKQRVLIARSVAQNTPCVLLDEPVNHLDIKHRTEVLEILRQENQNHQKTIVAVMHDVHDVKRYFQDVLFLKDGEVQYCGPVDGAFQPDLFRAVFEVEVASCYSPY